MGNRGEDASRPHGAWGRQPPRQSSPGAGAAGAGAWDDGSGSYWQDGDYPAAPGPGDGYGPADGYPAHDQGYRPHDPDYGQADGYYGPYEGQYGPGDGDYPPRPVEERPGGFGPAGQPRADGGYRPPGGYPAAPPETGGYPEHDAGNDWYGGQPAAASGASFADTGSYRLSGRTIDEYGTGPRGVLPDAGYGGERGRGTSGGYPLADDGYDDYRDGGYQAPGGYDDPGYDDHRQPAPYDGAGGGYDDYTDYGMPAGPYGQGGGDSGYRGARGAARSAGKGARSGGRGLLLAALAVVVIGIAGVAAYVFVLKPKSSPATSDAAAPLPTGSAPASQQACAKQLGMYCHIELRSDDPTALTTAELFPPAFISEADKISYQLVSTKVDKSCSNAVIGSDLSKALKTGKCTQALRATYVSGNGKIMGTIGVVNLETTHEAHIAGRVVGRSDFVAPLASAKGVTAKLGKGTGVVQAQYKGHYLILTWSEFVDGTKPTTTAQDKQLEQFGGDLVSGTANISLSQRMVTGAPSTPGASS